MLAKIQPLLQQQISHRQLRDNILPRLATVHLNDINKLSRIRELVEHDGFAVVPACLDGATVQLLSEQFDDARPPERNLLSVPSIQALAISKPVRKIMETVLGPACFAV
jgi:hypothetical protein